MRLFAGLPIPPDLPAPLLALAHRAGIAQTRYTDPANLHVTLYFLGEVAADRVPQLTSALETLRRRTLQLSIHKLGTFPRAGVLFAEVHPSPALLELQADVARLAAPFAARPDPNSPPLGDYHPHITLARSRQPLRVTERDLPAFREPIEFSAAVVNLYQSRSCPGGSRYEVLHAFG